jgi:hypothetical protein
MYRGGEELEVDKTSKLQVAIPIVHLWKELSSKVIRSRVRVGSMANRRTRVARWHRELQEEEHEALVNLVNTLQINMQNASAQWKTAMDLLISQRQGFQ